MEQARITTFLLWVPRRLVFCDKILCHWVRVLVKLEHQRGPGSPKNRYFATVGSSNAKMVANWLGAF